MLSSDLLIPLFSYDAVREKMIEKDGWQADPRWQERLEQRSYLTLFFAVDSYLRGRNSLILEASFTSEKHSQPLQKLIASHTSRALQIVCGADVRPLMIPGRIYHLNKQDSGASYRGLLSHIKDWLLTPGLDNLLSLD
jgi:hypothetical protein